MKTIGKIIYFLGALLVFVFFIRLAWIKESQGVMFPEYITPILMIVLVFAALGFYIVGCYLFERKS